VQFNVFISTFTQKYETKITTFQALVLCAVWK